MSTLDKLGGAGSADGRLLTALPVAEASPCQCQAMRARMKDATKRSRPTPRTHGKCRMLGWSQMPSTRVIRCSATVETGTSAARRRRYSRLVNGISPLSMILTTPDILPTRTGGRTPVTTAWRGDRRAHRTSLLPSIVRARGAVRRFSARYQRPQPAILLRR